MNMGNRLYRNYFKLLIDFFIALTGILVLWPLMIIIACLIYKDSAGGYLFKQERLGKELKKFTVYKFRTMVPRAYEIGGATSYDGDPRITRVGKFLRKTSLDELPQLFNILLGDMSIIGPRPILEIEYEPFKALKKYDKRYSVRPGLFCTVDIKYRANASRELQLDMDIEYVDNMSLILDIKTFFQIFGSVIMQKNVYKSKEEK